MASIKKYTTKNGQKRYMFRLYLGIDPQTGKKKQTTRRGFKTQKAAKMEISRLQLELDKDGELKKTQHITFGEVYAEFIESYKLTVRASTLRNVKSSYNAHIIPEFKDKCIESIKRYELQKRVNNLPRTLSLRSYIISKIKRIFNYAYKAQYIDKNPFDLITIPKVNRKDHADNFYTKEELEQFFNTHYFDNPKHFNVFVYFRLLAFSGMRKCEALALKWTDVDFEKGLISINKTVTLGNGYKLTVNAPKTTTSNRTISIDNKTMDYLRKWRLAQQKSIALDCGASFNKDTIIFTNRNYDHCLGFAPNRWLRSIYKSDRSLRQITVHGFRHTHASLLFAAGVSVKEAQVRLGHTDAKMTLDIYTHLSKEQANHTAEKLSKYANF